MTISSPRKKHSVVFAVYVSSIAALGGLLFGYDTAVISGTVEFLQKRFVLSDLTLGWTVSSALVGCVFGAWLAGGIGDRIGRKRSLLICAVLFFVSAVWSGIATSAGELVVARIVGGIGVGMASMMTPVYIAEVSPARLRGSLTTLNQIAVLVGMVLVYLVNARLAVAGDEAWRIATAWRWMFASGAFPSVIFFLLLFAIPESPRWLFMKGREKEAISVLERIGGHDGIAGQIEEIHRSLDHKKGLFSDCLRPPIRRIFFIGAGLAVLQQITGINIVLYYAPRIFTSAGLDASSAIGHSVIIGLVMLLFTLVALFLSDRAGRRPLLLLSATGMAVGLFALGFAYARGGEGGNAWGLLFWVLVYVASFSIGMGPLVWTVISEIFPNRVRAHAASASVLCLWLANFVVSQFFPCLLRTFEYRVFWLFGILCVASIIFIGMLIPETKGRTLEEIGESRIT